MLALALAAAALGAPAAQADGGEAVRLGVDVPGIVASAASFRTSVHVTADPGALDIRSGALRVRMKAASECGGSFDTTSGPVLVDAQLRPDPPTGAAYDGSRAPHSPGAPAWPPSASSSPGSGSAGPMAPTAARSPAGPRSSAPS